jgi:glutathione peroxidase
MTILMHSRIGRRGAGRLACRAESHLGFSHLCRACVIFQPKSGVNRSILRAKSRTYLHRASRACISISVKLSTLLDGFPFSSESASAASSIHEFTLNSIDGQPVPLAQFQGKVALIVNVASRCGFTPQYAGLEALYNKYRDRGFVVLGFPANNFLWQEPGSNQAIQEFCSTRYHVTFPMFAKVSVKGSDKTPLYRFLTDKQANPSTGGEIRWNFTKFLADRDGKVIARFGSKMAPESPEVIAAIEAALV